MNIGLSSSLNISPMLTPEAARSVGGNFMPRHMIDDGERRERE